MDDPKYQVGDSVLIFGGLNARQTGTVSAVEPSDDRLAVRVEWFSNTKDVNVGFDDVCLLSPLRRPIIEDIIKSLAHPLKLVNGCRRNAWWARKAMSDANEDPQTLLSQYNAFRNRLDNQQNEELLQRQAELSSLLQNVASEEHGEWWLANWQSYVCWGSAECERLMCELIDPNTIELTRKEIIEGDEGFRQLATSDPEEFDTHFRSRLQPLWNKLVQAGIALCQSCNLRDVPADGASN